MRVSYKVPAPGVQSFKWVANHHYIELEDKDGNITKMPATALLKCSCRDPYCGMVFFVSSNMGPLKCPHCGSEAEKEWVRPQLSFVPQERSDFSIGMTADIEEEVDLEEDTDPNAKNLVTEESEE